MQEPPQQQSIPSDRRGQPGRRAGLEGAGEQRAVRCVLLSVHEEGQSGEESAPPRASCSICSAMQLRGMQEPPQQQSIPSDRRGQQGRGAGLEGAGGQRAVPIVLLSVQFEGQSGED